VMIPTIRKPCHPELVEGLYLFKVYRRAQHDIKI
jgi:hypothetical protein